MESTKKTNIYNCEIEIEEETGTKAVFGFLCQKQFRALLSCTEAEKQWSSDHRTPIALLSIMT